jgi:hypothetical protein
MQLQKEPKPVSIRLLFPTTWKTIINGSDRSSELPRCIEQIHVFHG